MSRDDEMIDLMRDDFRANGEKYVMAIETMMAKESHSLVSMVAIDVIARLIARAPESYFNDLVEKHMHALQVRCIGYREYAKQMRGD